MARCTRCGAQNPDYALYCGKCGGDVTKDENAVIVPTVPPEPPRAVEHASGVPGGPEAPKRKCARCGKSVNAGARVCPYCWNNPSSEPPEGPARPRTPTPLVGGTCAIFAGALAILQGASFLAGEAVFFDVTGNLSGILIVLGIIEIVFGLASVYAGIIARQRRHYGESLVGSVLGMVAFGFGVGGFLGLVAVILIALSHDEFKS